MTKISKSRSHKDSKYLLLQINARILTPIIKKTTKFHFKGCKWVIDKPKWTDYGKFNPSTNSIYTYRGYVGEIKVTYKCRTQKSGILKLYKLLKIVNIGRFSKEGCGQILWKSYKFINYINPRNIKHQKQPKYKLKIRKGLDQNLPKPIKDLVRYGLLHDFYECLGANGSIYRSKIFYEPQIKNKELLNLLKLSHSKPKHILVNTNSRYDGIAASITRQHKSSTKDRYNWKAINEGYRVDFKKLANTIGKIVNGQSLNRLYKFVLNSKDLASISESQRYGYTSLRNHLLIIVNLIIRDYYNGNLDHYITAYQANFLNYRTRKGILVQDSLQ